MTPRAENLRFKEISIFNWTSTKFDSIFVACVMADHCYHIIKFCTYTCIFSLGIITSGCEIEKTRTPEIFDCPTLQIRKESKIYVLLDMYVCNAIVMLWAVCWHNQLHLILISLAHHSSYEIENYRLPSCKAFLLCDIM